MKKLFMIMAAAACLLAACEKEENGVTEPYAVYQLDSTPLEGSRFEEYHDTQMRFVIDGSTLQMNKVQFAAEMPVRIDIEVPGVTLDENGCFEAASVIPSYLGQPMPQYAMTNFKLTADSKRNVLTVVFDCMTMHVEYRGTLKER